MKTMRLFPLELKRLLQSRLTWLMMALAVLSPVLGLVLYKPATSTTMLSMYLANPAIAGGVAGAILFGLLTIFELDRACRSRVDILTDAVVSPLTTALTRLLALLMDFLVGRVEKLVTPVSFRLGSVKLDKNTNMRLRRSRRIAFAAVALVLVVSLGAMAVNAFSREEKVISVGSKNYTEQQVLGYMVSDLIEGNTDIKVDRRINLGGTQICFEAIKSGDIDLYIDYTGTAFVSMLNNEAVSDREYVYQTVREQMAEQFDIAVLRELNFNNTYVLAMMPDVMEEYGIECISDLKGLGDELMFSPTPEFSNREDGWLGLEKAYGLSFSDIRVLDGGMRYSAITNYETDIITAFSTDGLLKTYELGTLVDDQSFFVPYYAVPLIRQDTLDKYPELQPVLELLCSVLSDEVMRELNYQVDSLGRNPAEVAHEFLVEQGLIES